MSRPKKIIAACAACAAAVGLGVFTVIINRSDKEVPTYSSVEEPTQAAVQEKGDPLPDNWSQLYEYVPSPSGITPRAQALLHVNKDIIGWITIDGTPIDYPFVLDPGEVTQDSDDFAYYGYQEYIPDEYYLDHDLDGSYLRCGTLYADYREVFAGTDKDHSENMVIFGHNMANNSMFGSLRRYRQDSSFYETAPFIKLSSNYRDYDYVIFAYLITSGSYNATEFRYWNMEELDTQEEFDFYLDCCHQAQMLDTGIDVNSSDKLLTLSTCYADEDNSRFLVVARRLRDGEVAGDLSSIQRTDEYIQAQEAAEKYEEHDTPPQNEE